MKHIALSKIKDNLPRFLREAASEQLVITRHGRPAGILVGFASEDDWLDYRLEHDPGFLDRIASARASIQAGRGVRIEDLNAVLRQTIASNESAAASRRSASRARVAGHSRARRALQRRSSGGGR